MLPVAICFILHWNLRWRNLFITFGLNHVVYRFCDELRHPCLQNLSKTILFGSSIFVTLLKYFEIFIQTWKISRSYFGTNAEEFKSYHKLYNWKIMLNIFNTTSLNDIINQSLVFVSPISTYLCSSDMNSLLTEWHNSYKSIAFACLLCRMCCFSLILSSRARFSGLWLDRLKPTTFLRFAVVAHWTKRLKKAFSQTVKSALGTWLTQPVVDWFNYY